MFLAWCQRCQKWLSYPREKIGTYKICRHPFWNTRFMCRNITSKSNIEMR